MIEDLIDYFQAESDKLESQHSASKIYPNPSDKGFEREQSFIEFLKRHTPKKCEVDVGGFVFDINDYVSSQIDIILSTDFTLQFKDRLQSSKSFNCVEGCYATFSVKSNLDKNQLEDSIDNLSSVPLLGVINSNPLANNIDTISKQIPLKVIFSYKGYNPDNLLKNLINYKNEKHIPTEKMPDFVIVNKKFYAWKVITPVKTINNGQTLTSNYGDYVVEDGYNKIGGVALFHLLTTIQKISNLSIMTLFSFSKYFDKVYTHMNDNKIEP